MPRKARHAAISPGLTTQVSATPPANFATFGKGKRAKISRARSGRWSQAKTVSPQVAHGLATMINGLTTLKVDLSKITPDQLYQYGLTCFTTV